jgi:hypothetical protein
MPVLAGRLRMLCNGNPLLTSMRVRPSHSQKSLTRNARGARWLNEAPLGLRCRCQACANYVDFWAPTPSPSSHCSRDSSAASCLTPHLPLLPLPSSSQNPLPSEHAQTDKASHALPILPAAALQPSPSILPAASNPSVQLYCGSLPGAQQVTFPPCWDIPADDSICITITTHQLAYLVGEIGRGTCSGAFVLG